MSKDKILSQEHFYSFHDWEVGLDRLFMNCIHLHRKGLALFSNTARKDQGYPHGDPIPDLSLRLKQGLDHELTNQLRSIAREDFDILLQLQQNAKPELFDFYVVNHSALPDLAMVNFIYGDDRNAILVFNLMSDKLELLNIITRVNEILAPEDPAKSIPEESE